MLILAGCFLLSMAVITASVSWLLHTVSRRYVLSVVLTGTAWCAFIIVVNRGESWDGEDWIVRGVWVAMGMGISAIVGLGPLRRRQREAARPRGFDVLHARSTE